MINVVIRVLNDYPTPFIKIIEGVIKMNKNKKVISLILKSLIIVIALAGVIKGAIETGPKVFLYFTQLSNVLAIIVAAIFIYFDINELREKEVKIHRFMYYLKFAATVGVALTFIVFWALLAKDEPISYLLSFNNISLHTLAPILMIVEYILFTEDYQVTKKSMTSALIPPLAYFIFAMVLMAFNVTFGGNQTAPYFFLDYKNSGWFGFSDGLGVFYWIIIVLGIIYLLALFINFLHKLRINALLKNSK